MRRDDGSAAVEFAMTMPAVVAMLAAVLAGVAWGHTSLRAYDAAAVGARVAIADGDAAVIRAAHTVAGPGAEVSIARGTAIGESSGAHASGVNDGWVSVVVTIPGQGWMPSVEATAVAKQQP